MASMTANTDIFEDIRNVFGAIPNSLGEEDPSAENLMDFLSNTGALMAQDAKGRFQRDIDCLFLSKDTVAKDPLRLGATQHQKDARALLRGSHPCGMRCSIVKVMNDDGEAMFMPIIEDRVTQRLLVVGAPEPHGPYKSSARDGHYAVHLAFFLGNVASAPPSDFVVKLDVDAKAEKVLGKNLISIGGPGTNIVTAEFNRHLPIRFDEGNFWSGLVDRSGKRYSSDNHGLIARIRNPYDESSSIVIVAGVRSAGTKSAVIALTNYGEEVLKKYKNKEDWALVVQGFDMDADGKIDHVDVVS